MVPLDLQGANEQVLLRELMDTFKTGDLVVGDSFYGAYFLLVSMIEKGVDVVIEQQGARKRSTDFRKGIKLGNKDHLIDLPKPKIKPDWMTVTIRPGTPNSDNSRIVDGWKMFNIKRRPKPFALLMKTRHLAREEIKKYGYPKKLKSVPFGSDLTLDITSSLMNDRLRTLLTIPLACKERLLWLIYEFRDC